MHSASKGHYVKIFLMLCSDKLVCFYKDIYLHLSLAFTDEVDSFKSIDSVEQPFYSQMFD
jgi:hypothetical protein